MEEFLENQDEFNKNNDTENAVNEVFLLEMFNETMVEPQNHTRKQLIEDDCLSYL